MQRIRKVRVKAIYLTQQFGIPVGSTGILEETGLNYLFTPDDENLRDHIFQLFGRKFLRFGRDDYFKNFQEKISLLPACRKRI